MLHTKKSAVAFSVAFGSTLKICSLTFQPLHTLTISLLESSEGGIVGRKSAQRKKIEFHPCRKQCGNTNIVLISSSSSPACLFVSIILFGFNRDTPLRSVLWFTSPACLNPPAVPFGVSVPAYISLVLYGSHFPFTMFIHFICILS